MITERLRIYRAKRGLDQAKEVIASVLYTLYIYSSRNEEKENSVVTFDFKKIVLKKKLPLFSDNPFIINLPPRLY